MATKNVEWFDNVQSGFMGKSRRSLSAPPRSDSCLNDFTWNVSPEPDNLLEHAAQRLIQVALRCDSSISLLPVQIEDRCVRLVIRLTAANLARAATTSNLGLQLDDFRNFAVLKP